MKITEKHITEAQLKEIASLILDEKAIIGLDINDVKYVLEGKEGMIYEGLNDEDEDNTTFMRHFFIALSQKEDVRTSSTLLVNIGMAAESPLMMEDMNTFHEFFQSFDNEDLEIKWDIKTNAEGMGMTILVICAHPITQ